MLTADEYVLVPLAPLSGSVVWALTPGLAKSPANASMKVAAAKRPF